MKLCNEFHWTDISNPCVRDSFAAIVPAVFVGCILITSIPQLRRRLGKLGRPLATFLSYSEAEALLSGSYDSAHGRALRAPLWPQILLSCISLVQSLVWLGIGCYNLTADSDFLSSSLDILMSSTWLYAALRLLIWPTLTVPYDLFSLFVIHLLFSFINGAGYLYDHYVYATPFPAGLEIVLRIGGDSMIAVLLAVVLNMRLMTSSETKEGVRHGLWSTLSY